MAESPLGGGGFGALLFCAPEEPSRGDTGPCTSRDIQGSVGLLPAGDRYECPWDQRAKVPMIAIEMQIVLVRAAVLAASTMLVIIVTVFVLYFHSRII